MKCNNLFTLYTNKKKCVQKNKLFLRFNVSNKSCIDIKKIFSIKFTINNKNASVNYYHIVTKNGGHMEPIYKISYFYRRFEDIMINFGRWIHGCSKKHEEFAL